MATQGSRLLTFVSLLLCGVPVLVRGQGISEPPVVFYGTVYTEHGGGGFPTYSGELVWRIAPLGGGEAFEVTAPLSRLAGGEYSYAVEVPAEKAPPGRVISPGTMEAGAGLTGYEITVSMWGEGACFLLGGEEVGEIEHTTGEVMRGARRRLDVVTYETGADRDSDGMPDFWEEAYPSALNADDPGDAWGDADGDSVRNIEEFFAGSDPSCVEWNRWLRAWSLDPVGLGALDGDPDLDGMSNLFEYAFGGDPRTPDSSEVLDNIRLGFEETDDGETAMTLLLRTPGTRHCDSYFEIEIGSDLTWRRALPGVDFEVLSQSAGELKVMGVRRLGSVEGATHFLRVKVVSQ